MKTWVQNHFETSLESDGVNSTLEPDWANCTVWGCKRGVKGHLNFLSYLYMYNYSNVCLLIRRTIFYGNKLFQLCESIKNQITVFSNCRIWRQFYNNVRSLIWKIQVVHIFPWHPKNYLSFSLPIKVAEPGHSSRKTSMWSGNQNSFSSTTIRIWSNYRPLGL